MDAREVIERLRLAPHPEGGWYRETWRGLDTTAGRSPGSAILFLLEGGAPSRWHRIDADEVWAWHGGSPIELTISPDAGSVDAVRLGMDPARGEVPQAVVPADAWQSARARGAWALVSCIVVPGFRFEGFELAAEGWRVELGDRRVRAAAETGAARFVGDGENHWSMIHRNDLATLYLRIVEERAAGIFHGVDDSPTRVIDIARAASEAAGAGGETRSVPVEEARESLGQVADTLLLDQTLVTHRGEEIGWKPAHASFVEGAGAAWREYRLGERQAAGDSARS